MMSVDVRTIAAIGMVVSVALVTTSRAQAETTLRFNQVLPKSHWSFAEIIDPWKQRVAKATEGRVKIVSTGASLGGFGRSMDIAGQGIADIAFGNYGTMQKRFTLAKITEIPFLGASDPKPVTLAFWRTYQRYFSAAKEHEKAGTKLISLWTSGSNHFFMRERPIRTVADIKGKKFFVSSAVGREIVEKFGGVGLSVGGGQLYELFSRGVVDGGTMANTGPSAFRLDKFIRYQTVVPGSLYFSGFYIVMNLKKWEALPAKDRRAIETVSGESLAMAAAEVFQRRDRAALVKRKASKTEVTIASPAFIAEVKSKTAFIEDRWIARAKAMGYDGAAALKMLREIAAKAAAEAK